MAFDSGDFKGPGGVNVAECLRVADAVERSTTFGMLYVHVCGTPQCIAGHALTAERLLQYYHQSSSAGHNDHYPLMAEAAVALGLDAHESAWASLFKPRNSAAHFDSRPGEDGYISAAHAAAVLRKLAATGEVDWLGTKPAGSK